MSAVAPMWETPWNIAMIAVVTAAVSGYLGFSVGYNLGSMSPQSPLQIISQPDSIQVLPEAPG